MPELPEVETIRRGLEKYLVGRTIKNVEILRPKLFEGDVNNLEGVKILKSLRIGKGLILELSNKYSLAIHIKMTGQLIFRDKKTKNEVISTKVGTIPNKHTHITFHLNDGGVLYYNDMRRFGWMKVIPTDEIRQLNFFKNMGPEPLKDLTLEKFKEVLSKSTTKIKPLIMDQTKIGGIGNIYANDALFDAKIDPSRSAKSLKSNEMEDLFNSILKVLKKSLEVGGASELSYVNVLGQEGGYQHHSLVYGKDKKPCPRGDGIIKRIVLGGRGTFYCSNCQN